MDGSALYDRDFAAWAEEQAVRLKDLIERKADLPLDLENLAEEVAALARDQIYVVEENLTKAVIHLLKLEWSLHQGDRRHWIGEAAGFRVTAKRKLRRSPSLMDKIDVGSVYGDAKHILGQQWATDLSYMPAECPWTVEQLLDLDFIPANRHGLSD
jgi:hypothetical protein